MCFKSLFPPKTHLVNEHTREIHDIANSKKSCRISMITSKNRRMVTTRKAMRLLGQGYDGCRFCMPEYDNG